MATDFEQWIADLERELFPHQESEFEQESFTTQGRERVRRFLERFAERVRADPDLLNSKRWVQVRDLSQLKVGDFVRNKMSKTGYVVTQTFGDRATAVKNADITNAPEWEVLASSSEVKS
jgi:hypothetical protein